MTTRDQDPTLPASPSSVMLSGVPGLRTDTVGAALRALAETSPTAPALMSSTESGVESVTYSELYEKSSRLAATLAEINPDRKRVALISFNSVNWIIGMYGCALAGVSVVPIAPSATDEETAHQLEAADVGAVLAIKSYGVHEVLERIRSVASSIPGVVAVCDLGEAIARQPSPTGSTVAVSPEDELLLQYTSGTTGKPKPAVLSHFAAMNSAHNFARACRAAAGDRWLNPLPLHHVGGSVAGVITCLTYGGAYIVVEQFTAESAVRAIRDIQPALVGMVPTMLLDLLELPGVGPSSFRSVRTVIGGATAVDPHLIERVEQLLGITFMVSYGQSEAPILTCSSPEDTPMVRTRSLGRCLPGRDYVIRDKNGHTVNRGQEGELHVRGPLVMTGYLRDDGTLNPATDANGWLATGDLCVMDDDDVLTFRGRLRDVIIRGGVNVYPAEVEAVLSAHPSISEAAVFGVPDERWGERVAAAVIPATGAAVDVHELAAFAAEKLAGHKGPVDWLVVDEMPRTSTGKVRKHLLRENH